MRIVLAVLFFLLLNSAVFADRTIVTPSAYGLDTGFDNETLQTVSGQPRTVEYLDVAVSDFQFETAYAARPGVNRLSESIQTTALPETTITPALSIGIKDLLNSTGQYSADGFYGRAYYLVATKSLGNLLIDPDSPGFRVSGGLGFGAYHGLFGGVTAVLTLKLSATGEYDGHSANYEISLKTSARSRLSAGIINGLDTVGFEFE